MKVYGTGITADTYFDFADGVEEFQTELLLVDGIIFGDEDLHFNTECGKIFRQCTDDIGKSAGLCERRALGSDDGRRNRLLASFSYIAFDWLGVLTPMDCRYFFTLRAA